MKRYIAFLRGINISGKNRVPMAELKKGFTELGFTEVASYLNSGNIAFSSAVCNENTVSCDVTAMIRSRFGLDIPVFIIPREELRELLNNAPDWWGNDDKEIYDNLIFLIPPLSFEQLYNELGAPREGYERIQRSADAVFWSFSRKDYNKTNWWSKTASSPVGGSITIRTANTVKRAADM